MFRFLFTLIILAAIAFGGWYAWDNVPFFQKFVNEKVHSSEFQTLEIRYTADEIMHKNKKELLKGSGYTFLEPKLMFYPYLMMSIKYMKDNMVTEEGMLLWGLTDGEMVLDTASWETTHGFEDCIISHATHQDFQILRTIVEIGGAIDRERLYQKFKVDADVVDKWVKSCRNKKLIVASGNRFRLHLQNPLFETRPITYIDEPLVTQPTKHTLKMKKKYTVSQIQKLSTIAFGRDFAIRKTEQVFLPVYSIAVQNPDGSVRTTFWNALNGKQFVNQGHS